MFPLPVETSPEQASILGEPKGLGSGWFRVGCGLVRDVRLESGWVEGLEPAMFGS